MVDNPADGNGAKSAFYATDSSVPVL